MERRAGSAAGPVQAQEEKVLQSGLLTRGEGTEVPAGQDTVAAPAEVEEAVERYEEKFGDVFRALAVGPASGPVQAQEEKVF